MTTNIKEFYLNPADIQFILDQVQFPTIIVIGYDADGNPLYGLSAAGVPTDTVNVKGTSVGVTNSALNGARVISIQSIFMAAGSPISGTLGSFDPLDPIFASITYHDTSTNTDIALPSYTSARDYEGLRNVSGEFNNLIFGTATAGSQLTWGAANETFLRLVKPDYMHYLQGDTAGNLLNSDTAKNFNTSSTAINGESAHVDQIINVAGADFTVTTWTETVTRIEKSVALESLGQHTTVNTGSSTTTTTDATQNWVQIGDTANYSEHNANTTEVINSNYISGGELDNHSYVKFDATVNAWVPALASDYGAMLAHTFKTVDGDINSAINGIDGHAVYSNPLANVVDYTPRMISQTISSSYNQPDSALERLGIATDTATYDVKNVDGTTSSYTEHFIENTNSYAADPSYSGWFVLFGQFFDHGLDFIQKPSGGPTIQIALAVDDPLYGQIGPDGKPVTSLNISRATPSDTGPGQYQNTDSPYIDQNQTYGATDQITMLLREWVKDPNTGAWLPGAALLDGHTVEQTYLSTVFSDAGARSGDGEGLTDRTLPTLNELRAALAATGRDDLSWEDINNYRARDAQGHILLDSNGNPINTGQAVLLDILPRFDATHLSGANAASAIQTLNASISGLGTLTIDSGGAHAGELHLNISGSGPQAGDYFGAAAMAPWFDFATNAIQTNLFGLSGMPLSSDQHSAAGELLLESIGDHYVAGDGRANENFGLTTIHHVFHEDHNVQLINLESTILAGMYDGNPDKAKGFDWMAKVTASVSPAEASGHVEPDATHQDYVGATYDFSNLHIESGVYVADLTNIRDARGNIVKDSDGVTPLTIHGVYTDANGVVSWNQDMLFNASKLIVEMEYQHVAIDQYARFVTPDLPEFVTYDANINADISLEYAQAAFRFGHSQLRETIDAIETQGTDHNFDITATITHYALAAGFLNPAEFAEVGPGAIALGMTHQVGNETDEFVTSALQQNLLGQALDLAAINIARGRDVGIPTLNEVRKQLYAALVAERANTNGPTAQAHANIQLDLLKPYNSWNEFAGSMIHPESLVNFIAAYSFDGDVQKAAAVIGLDAGTITLGAAQAALGASFTASMAHQFMSGALNADGSYAVAGADGFNSVDLWIGGLAESHVLGGILGPTFNAIFEDQMERLMDGDRFYYLYRLFGALPQITNLNTQITNEQFKDIVERTTGVTHLNGDIMLYADSYIELGHQASAPTSAGDEHKYGDQVSSLQLGVYSAGGASTGGNGDLITVLNPEYSADPANVHAHSLPQYITYVNDVRPDSPDINSNGNPTYGYNSHEVIAGTDYNDYIDTGDGDDTAYGGKGDDILVGNGGSEHLYGEDGNDVLYGAGGTAGADVADFLDGGAGDDYIYGGQNAGATEILIGGMGNDHLYGEAGIDEIYGDNGDDYIDAGGDTDLAFGGAGNDEMYGGEGPDELHGGDGSDLISGGSGTDKLEGEQGDDILFGGQGGGVAQGDSDELIGGDAAGAFDPGFNIAAYSDSSIKLDVAADLNNQQLQGVIGTNAGTSVPYEPFNHFYMDINGIIGTKYDDAVSPTAPTVENPRGNPSGAGLVGDDTANWLIGGSGNDIIQGQDGFDVIVGGSIRLDTLIGTYGGYTNGVDANGNATHSVTGSLTGGLLADSNLGTQMFDKHFTELLMSENRKDFVLGDGGTDGTQDTAVYLGKFSEYTLSSFVYHSAQEGDVTVYKIVDNGGLVDDGTGTGTLIPRASDGTDLLIGVDVLKFADRTVSLNNQKPVVDLHAFDTSTSDYADNFNTASWSNSSGSAPWTTSWSETGDPSSGSQVTNGQIQIDAGNFGGSNQLRLYDTGDGASIQRAVNLSGASAATLSFSYSESNFDFGASNNRERVVASFSFDDGATWHALSTFNSSTNGGGNYNVNLASLLGPTETFGAQAIVKFEAITATGGNSNGYISIDNLDISVTKQTPANDGGSRDYAVTFTEKSSAQHIALNPLITDDSTTLTSAKIVLTNAYAGDVLNRNDVNGDGIVGTTDTSVPGQITVTLTAQNSAGATLADFENAIAAVTFSNSSNNPNPADRIIHVTVNDGLVDSDVVTTTVHVVPVNDPPNATTDYVIGNATTVVVPNWALLNNDTDPDGPSLGITATSSLNGLNSASLVTNPGSVTIVDNATQGGSFAYTVNDGSGSTNATSLATVNFTRSSGTTITGSSQTRDEILVGRSGDETFTGNRGDDIVLAGGGNDRINWTATSATIFGFTFTTSQDGHDIIDGGTGTDTFAVQGDNTVENFDVYSIAAAQAAGITGLNAQTEVVVTRNGAVIGELAHIEEITINTGGGNDSVAMHGNFAPTSLAYSTITINDSDGGDKVDITGLTSDHRIVFNTNSNGQLIGQARPQDVVNVSDGLSGTGAPAGSDDPVGHSPGDTFHFNTVKEVGNNASRQTIQHFDMAKSDPADHDILDLSGIDANSGKRGNQSFIWDAEEVTNDKHARGHVGYHYVTINGVEHTIISGNTNSNHLGHNFQIDLVGHLAFTPNGPDPDVIL